MTFDYTSGFSQWNQPFLGGYGYDYDYNNYYSPSGFDMGTSIMPEFGEVTTKKSRKKTLLEKLEENKKKNAQKMAQISANCAQIRLLETGADANGNTKFKVQTDEQGQVIGFVQDEKGNFIPDPNGMEIPDSLAAQKKVKAELTTNVIKKSDGSVNVVQKDPEDDKKLKDCSLLEKACGIGSAVWSTTMKIGKDLIGIEEDGSWNPWKCALNVGLTALCFIPGGAVVSGAVKALQAVKLVKTAATAAKVLKPFATAVKCATNVAKFAGKGFGLYMLGSGAIEMAQADTMGQLKDGASKVTLGSIVGGATGLFKKGFKLFSKAGRQELRMSIKTAFNNSLNVVKNPIASIKNSWNTQASQVNREFRLGFKGLRDSKAKAARKSFESNKAAYEKGINDRIAQINTELKSNPTNDILRAERTLLEKNLHAVRKAKNLKSWHEAVATAKKNVEMGSKMLYKNRGKVARKWIGFRKSLPNWNWLGGMERNSLEKSLRESRIALHNLKKERIRSMQQMAVSSNFNREVERFGFTNGIGGRLSNPVKGFWSNVKDSWCKEPAKFLMTWGFLPFDPAGTMGINANTMFKAYTGVSRPVALYNSGYARERMFVKHSAEEYQQMTAQLNQNIQDIEKQINALRAENRRLA